MPRGEDPWTVHAPSDFPFAEGGPVPVALDEKGLARVSGAFCQAADRAVRLGFDAIELHMAHGYLLHSFVSPLSNRRSDGYGGSRQNRMRFPIEVARAVRARVPRGIALGARITGTDWADGGLTADDAVAFAAELKAAGLDYVCVSGGGAVPHVKIPVGARLPGADGRQGEGRSRARHRAVGMILEPAQAEAIVASGQADFVALARALARRPALGVARGRAPRRQHRLSAAVRARRPLELAGRGDRAAERGGISDGRHSCYWLNHQIVACGP